MSEPLNLDAIEARSGGAPLAEAAHVIGVDVPALVAEVRRLRAIEDEVRSMPAMWPLLDTFTP